MTDDPIGRLAFPDEPDALQRTPPGQPPPARFDADPDISADMAVDRGEATDAEREWAEWLREEPVLLESENTTEITIGADQLAPSTAVSYFAPADPPKIPNEDGTTTTLETTQPDPRSEDR